MPHKNLVFLVFIKLISLIEVLLFQTATNDIHHNKTGCLLLILQKTKQIRVFMKQKRLGNKLVNLKMLWCCIGKNG